MNHHLFTVGNTKTLKGEKYGWLTIILHLLPADSAGLGVDVCPNSTPECRELCLVTAGMGVFNSVHQARLNRTKAFVEDRRLFRDQLVEEIEFWNKHAERKNLKLAIRVNGTSDLPALARSVQLRSDGTFYDYTKIVGAIPLGNKGPIHYTFSRSENNEAQCIQALDAGANVAVVFSTKKGEDLPKEYSFGGVCPVKVVDGDVSDLRFLDPAGVIVGLRAKGRARQHRGGFVVAV